MSTQVRFKETRVALADATTSRFSRHASRLTLRWIGPAALVIAIGLLWLFLPERSLAPERITAALQGLGALGLFACVLAVALAVVIGPIPTVPFAVAAGMVYGVVPGVVASMAGGLLGAAAAFLIARHLARRPLASWLANRRLPVLVSNEQPLFLLILACRLVPVVSFALVSYAAGLSALSLSRFLLATLLGMFPMTLLYSLAGSGLAAGSSLAWIGAGLLLAVAAALPFLLTGRGIFGNFLQPAASLSTAGPGGR